MATYPCIVLYGNSVFLAGIQAGLEGAGTLEVIVIEAETPNAMDLIRARRPRAVLFDLTMAQPDFAIPLLCEQPDLLLVGVEPSSNQMQVLSSQPEQALSIQDLVNIIHPCTS